MATRKGKRPPRKARKAEPTAVPPEDLQERLPDVPEEETEQSPQQAATGTSDEERLLELCRQVQARPDLATARALMELSGRLEDRFRSIREQSQRIAQGLEAREALAAICPPPVEPEGAPTGGTGLEAGLVQMLQGKQKDVPLSGGQTLAEFFQRVSISVIRAQEELDGESVRYAASVQGTQIPPMHFAIPNVHAEVKMGFNTEGNSNLLVKLFGRPEDAANYGESTVSFDVVATAPPPGVPPAPGLVVTGPERSEALKLAKVGDDQKSSAVVLRSGGAFPYLVIASCAEPAGDIRIYRVSPDRPEQIETIPLDPSPLRDALAELISGQLAKTSR